jgi:hypothetical protein
VYNGRRVYSAYILLKDMIIVCGNKRKVFGNITDKQNTVDVMDSGVCKAIMDTEVKEAELSPQTSAVELCSSSNSPGITLLLM